MPYEVMARRYRPATFSEVVGQEHIARTLQNAIRSGRVGHAYLFCGGHGCGKTTMARVFAKALVCQQGPTPEPCNQCPFCQDVARGRDVDVIEIDGASNNGVEQIRTLRDQAGYVPARARFKIFIIDEVHMLSVPAFNALLKTLEEPPPHVKFILATTDPHKIPDTILSRCQRFDFRLVPPGRLAAFFKELAARENAPVDDDALAAVAAFAGGSVRDGLVLLDQLLSYADGTVTREDVERIRGVAGAESVAGLYRAVAGRDAVRALAVVDEVAARGVNVGDFLDQLIDFGRDLMALSATGGQASVTAYGPAREALAGLAGATTLDRALVMLDVFAQARTKVRMKALTNPLVVLEMAVARLAGLPDLAPLATYQQRLEQLARGGRLPPGTSTPVPASVPVPPPAFRGEVPPSAGPSARPAPSPLPAVTDASVSGEDAETDESFPAVAPEDSGPPDAVDEGAVPSPADRETPLAEETWTAAQVSLAKDYPEYLRRLADVVPTVDDRGDLRLTGPEAALEPWDDALRLGRLGAALHGALNRPFVLRCGDRSVALPPADGAAAAMDGGSEPAFPGDAEPAEGRAGSGDGRETEEAQLWNHPMVKQVQSLFEAKPMTVKWPEREES